jgi:four helix bundle protein
MTKSQTNSNTKMENSKPYDLEERTYKFSKDVILFINVLPKTVANTEMVKQVIRSSGSVGANYIEANESLGKKDLTMRLRICRKEAKETMYWLKLLEISDEDVEKRRQILINETLELTRIFGSIIEKVK